MTPVVVAEPGCTNELLCGRAMAIRPADLWHPVCVPACRPPPEEGTSTLGGRAQLGERLASEASRSVSAKSVSLKTLSSLKPWFALSGIH